MTANAYSFLSWLRRGIATQITHAPGAAARARVSVELAASGTPIAGGIPLTAPVRHDVELYGPGDIVGVDRRAVVRTDPRDWITNFDANYLVTIEFYDEDFPWRYSPDVLDPVTGRVRPWLALIVLTEAEFTDQGVLPGRPLPSIEVADLGTLPPPDQLGAWAHVHANRTVTASDAETVSTDMTAVLPRLAAILAENPDLACSRLICPRRLDPQAGYHAFLVPSFETGRLAGLDHDPAGAPGALHSSWVAYAGRPESGRLPYYHRWQFRTAPVGDFEYLARLLKPRGVDARVGNRDMDVRQPGVGLPGIDDPRLGGTLRLGGALKVPDTALSQPELAEQALFENWDQPYPHPFQHALAALINLAEDYRTQTVQAAHKGLTSIADSFATSQTVSPADPDPLITPPLYGRWHALTSRLLTDPDGTPITPNDNWVHELNLDPRFRVAAGTGGRIVRRHEEEFMQAAWDQLGDVLEANKRIRAAQFAREVTFVYYRRHLDPLRQAATGLMLTLSAPLQSRVVPDAEALAALGLAPAAGARAVAPPPTIATVLADSVVGRTPLSPPMRRAIRPGSALMRRLPFGPGPGSGGGDGGGDGGGVDIGGDGGETGPQPGRHELLDRMNSGEVSAAPPVTAPEGVVTVDQLESELAGPIIELRQPAAAEPVIRLLPDPVPGLPTSSDFVVSLPGEGVHPTGGGADSVEALRFKQALTEMYAAFNSAIDAGDVPSRVSTALDAVAEATMDGLHPDVTVPRRALGGIRLPERFLPPRDGGDEPLPVPRAPAAVPAPDALSEVMAYPVIDLPMFRPLADVSAELFCPHVNLVSANSITLLETNPRFIESYLAGLNHEMARELLWREYPTDQRGSVFRQFWDVRSVLSPPGETPEVRRERLRDITAMHTWDKASGLGTHHNRGLPGEQLVLVIRGELLKKYPTAVIYAHRADWRRHPDGTPDPTQERTLVTLTPAEEADPPHDKVRIPLFDAKIEPDVYFFGFDLDETDARGGTGENPGDDPGWFFVLKERPGDPRFGLDIERTGPLQVWNDLVWPDVLPTDDGAGPAYIRLDASTPTLTLTAPGGSDVEKADQFAEDRALTWNGQLNSADVAYVLFQSPVLVAVHAREMLRDA